MTRVRNRSLFGRKSGRARRKGEAALKALRKAIARRKLEQYREAKVLRDNLYDVFSDEVCEE
jgi:hypothetical protein